MALTLLRRGQLIPGPSPEKATEFLRAEGKRGGPDERSANGSLAGRRGIIGSPEKVRAELEQLVSEYGAEEAMVVTITHDHQARRRSYELLAEAFGLEPAAGPLTVSADS